MNVGGQKKDELRDEKLVQRLEKTYFASPEEGKKENLQTEEKVAAFLISFKGFSRFSSSALNHSLLLCKKKKEIEQ